MRSRLSFAVRAILPLIALPAAGSNAPTVGAFAPPSASGSSVTVRVTYSDEDTIQAGSKLYLLINGTVNGTNSCLIEIDPILRRMRVADDNAASWLPTTVPIFFPSRDPGTFFYGPAENSNCAIPGISLNYFGTIDPTLSQDRKTFYLDLPIFFQPRFGGSKTIYALAVDENGMNSGYTVQTALSIPNAEPAPLSASLTAAAVDGSRFRTTVTAYTGGSPIFYQQHVFLATNTISSTVGGCIVVYDRRAQSWSLVNDAGNAFIGPSKGPISNSLCRVNSAAMQGLYADRAVAVFDVTILPPFNGPLGFSTYSQDYNGLRTNRYDTPGMVVTQPATAPITNLTLSNSSGAQATFQITVQNGDGVLPRPLDMIIAESPASTRGCLLQLEQSGAGYQAMLAEYNWGYWLTPFLTLGATNYAAGAAVADNGACRLLGQGSSYTVSQSGTLQTFTFKLGFSASFAGPKLIWVMNQNAAGGYIQKGTFTVTETTPPSVPITNLNVSSSSGSQATFQFDVQNADGLGPLPVDMIIAESASSTRGCLIQVGPAAGGYQARLAEYNWGFWLTPFLALGSANYAPGVAVAGNEACRLLGEGSSYAVTQAGTMLTVTFKLGFPSTFLGPKKIWVMNENAPGGYLEKGAFTVTN